MVHEGSVDAEGGFALASIAISDSRETALPVQVIAFLTQ
jgi:hypothetical protein